MAWTTPATAVTGDVVPASFWNTYGRDNLAYIKGLLDGTGSDTVTAPGAFRWNNDTNTALAFLTSARPYLGLDSNDYLEYDRNSNTFKFHIGSNDVLTLDTNGKLAGHGFYASSEQTITAGNTVTISHGLGARPRFVGLFGNSSSGVEGSATIPGYPTYDDAEANQISIYSVTPSQISVRNGFGATYYVYIYAML